MNQNIDKNLEEKQRVLLVGVKLKNPSEDTLDTDLSLDELEELTATAGGSVVGRLVQNVDSVSKRSFVGSGKLGEIKDFCENNDIDLIICDSELTYTQSKNIEEYTNVHVIDRTALILDIFAQRAISKEGKLQVELAMQKYLLPRLIGEGRDMSRLGGGIGTRGPGETKLETNRRYIRSRIHTLTQELKEVEKRRKLIRDRRKKSEIKTIAIVGYTNTGKSTLLNLLTDSEILAKDMLFATLDTTARELTLPDGENAIIIDTVGFIRNLPHHLVNAFKSTLEEATYADLILNVCDITDQNMLQQIDVTLDILSDLKCDDIPKITVYNKIDKLDNKEIENFKNSEDKIYISAKENIGIDSLIKLVSKKLNDNLLDFSFVIPYDKGSLGNIIRENGKITEEKYIDNGTLYEGKIDKKYYDKIIKKLED